MPSVYSPGCSSIGPPITKQRRTSTGKTVWTHRQKKLDDKADRARLYGWGGAILAAGSLGVALIPHKSTRRVFPELSFSTGTPTLRLAYVYRF